MSSKKRIYFSFLFLLMFAFAGNAYALQFNDAWIGHHYENGNPTGEYFLAIDKTDLKKVKLKGFKFKKSSDGADFFDLTGIPGNEGLTYFEINTKKSPKYNKFKRQAQRKSKKLIRKGLLDKELRQEWMTDYIDGKLEKKLFKLIFKDEYGDKYRGKIAFATFENPYPYSDDEGSGSAAPVPEPTTLLLLGTGLVGLAAFRRRFK